MPPSPQTPQPGTRRPSTDAAAFATPDFFVLRTPLLPVDELFAVGAELTAAHATPAELPAALAADRARLRDRLRGVLARPEVREAIFLASPSLEENIDAWREDPQSERGQRAEPALLRYLARMAGRPTPFGLFAGYSLGRAAEATALRVAGRESYARHTRLDDGYLAALAGRLGTAEDAKLLPNSSLYQAAGRLCYLRALPHGAALRYEAVSEAAPAPAAALALVLERLAATPGGLPGPTSSEPDRALSGSRTTGQPSWLRPRPTPAAESACSRATARLTTCRSSQRTRLGASVGSPDGASVCGGAAAAALGSAWARRIACASASSTTWRAAASSSRSCTAEPNRCSRCCRTRSTGDGAKAAAFFAAALGKSHAHRRPTRVNSFDKESIVKVIRPRAACLAWP